LPDPTGGGGNGMAGLEPLRVAGTLDPLTQRMIEMLPWLFLLLALAALAVAFKTSSIGVLALSLVVALAMVIAWVMSLLAQRIGNASRDEMQILDPDELRRMREQAEARRLSASPPDSTA
jgi:hypothetical protein